MRFALIWGMDLEYRETLPDADAYLELFESTGWNQEYRLTREELRAAASRSWFLLAGYHDGRLVGTGRVVSDGVLHALIVDVIVSPECQGQGIGASIMERLVERCRTARIRDVQLFCAKGKAPFYRRLGFVDRSADAPGMDWRCSAAS